MVAIAVAAVSVGYIVATAHCSFIPWLFPGPWAYVFLFWTGAFIVAGVMGIVSLALFGLLHWLSTD